MAFVMLPVQRPDGDFRATGVNTDRVIAWWQQPDAMTSRVRVDLGGVDGAVDWIVGVSFDDLFWRVSTEH